MGDEQTARARTAEARRAEWTAAGSYLLAGCVCAALGLISDLPAIQMAVTRLAWRFGRWPTFPFPYDTLWYSNYSSGDDSILLRMATIVGGTFGIALGVAILHTLIFSVVVVLYKWRGWPTYWADVRSRFLLRTVWARSAWRSWWIWPATFFVWILFLYAGRALSYILYPVIKSGLPFLLANLAAACFLFGLISARAVRRAVLNVSRREDLRCVRCGYLIHGLPQPRCPECGSQISYQSRYGLWRGQSRTSARIRACVTVALLAMLLLAPVWVPLSTLMVPRPWLRYIPRDLRGDLRIYSQSSNSFPIRVKAYCIIESDQSIAILQITKMSIVRADYRGVFWMNKSEFLSTEAPDSITDDHVSHGYTGVQAVSLGPWNLTVSGGLETMLWLNRPDASYSVSAYMEEDLPEEYQFIVEKWDEWAKR